MASVDAQFTSLMNDMKTFSTTLSNSLLSDGSQRAWMIPAGYTALWEFNPTTIATIGDPFVRDDVNQEYSDEFTGAGENKIKVVMGTNLEISYMCMMERSFRERHRTPTRALMLLAGRRKAHGDVNGVHKIAVEGYIQEMLDTS